MRIDHDKNEKQPMKTIFLSGSRDISCLNDDIRSRIKNIMDNGFHVIVGDANGADKALQKFLAESEYKNVTVFCAGSSCRNNIGEWEVQKVTVDPKLTGRNFYTQKDKEMAAKADYGLVLWDGKSAGSINNVFELLKNKKYAVVYFSPEKKFHNIKRLVDAQTLLKSCDENAVDSIKKKIKLNSVIRTLETAQQEAFGF